MKPKLIVFASGTKDGSSSTTPLGFSKTGYRQENLGGGSGFENLATSKELDADIVAVVSNHEHGGVRARAERLGIPFVYFNEKQHSNILQNVGMLYQQVVKETGADYVALSGWMRHVSGLDPARTINIHPALLSFDHGRFGGNGMWGHHVHEAVKQALDAGEITESGFSMHFVTEKLDRGPIIFEGRVPLTPEMTADDIAAAVNKAEHEWQPKITNMVVHGEIRWDGKNFTTLVIPAEYRRP